MPDIPQVPGVPALTSYAANAIVQVAADAVATLFSTVFGVQWGIYLFGVPVLSYDNQLSFGYQQEWHISTYPVEGGSFASYDKVQSPAEVRVRLSAGGSAANRFAMLETIDLQMSTTLLYDIVTPEKVFLNYNFVRREYERKPDDVGLISIDLLMMEVIQTATAQFQDTATAAVAGQQGLGSVFAAPTSASSAAAVGGRVF